MFNGFIITIINIIVIVIITIIIVVVVVIIYNNSFINQFLKMIYNCLKMC